MLREMSLALRKALPDEDDNFVVQAAYGTAWGAHAGSGMRFRNMCAHIQLTSNALESIAKGEDPNGITVRELRRLMWEIGRPVQPSQRGCDR